MSTPNESNITKTPPTTHLPSSFFITLCPLLSAREVISRRLKTKIGKAEEQIGEEGRQSRQAGRHRHKRLQELPRLPHTHTQTQSHTHRHTYICNTPYRLGIFGSTRTGLSTFPHFPQPPTMFVVSVLGDAFLVFWEPLFNCRRRFCTWLAVVFRPILGLAFVRATPLPCPTSPGV